MMYESDFSNQRILSPHKKSLCAAMAEGDTTDMIGYGRHWVNSLRVNVFVGNMILMWLLSYTVVSEKNPDEPILTIDITITFIIGYFTYTYTYFPLQ